MILIFLRISVCSLLGYRGHQALPQVAQGRMCHVLERAIHEH
jgi:hypothetical protein